jgi:hypothetical protein
MMKTSGTVTSALLVTLTMLAGATGCAPGAVGAEGAQTVCVQAVDHLAACGVTDLPDTGACTAAKERLASQILNRSCAEVAGRTTFSNSGCDSIWAVFNPSCWGSDDDDGTDEGLTSGSGRRCYCDNICESWGDCCDDCWSSKKSPLFGHCVDTDECDDGLTCSGGQQCLRRTYASCNGSNECYTNICRKSDQGNGMYGYCVCPLYDYKKPDNTQCKGWP